MYQTPNWYVCLRMFEPAVTGNVPLACGFVSRLFSREMRVPGHDLPSKPEISDDLGQQDVKSTTALETAVSEKNHRINGVSYVCYTGIRLKHSNPSETHTLSSPPRNLIRTTLSWMGSGKDICLFIFLFFLLVYRNVVSRHIYQL